MKLHVFFLQFQILPHLVSHAFLSELGYYNPNGLLVPIFQPVHCKSVSLYDQRHPQFNLLYYLQDNLYIYFLFYCQFDSS